MRHVPNSKGVEGVSVLDQPRDLLGRFEAMPHTSSGVSLMEELSDEEYNAEGTYRFPPNPRSWEQNAKFWATCPITDGQLREFINYYRQDYRHDPKVNEYAKEIMREWYLEHPGFNVAPDGELAQWDVQAYAEWERARDAYPHRKRRIHPAHARPIVRAAQMYEWSRYLGQEAIAKTREIEINVEPGEHWTVGKVIDEYRLVVVTAMINDRRNVEQTKLWERIAENDRAFHGENWGEKFRINKKGEPDVYFEQIFETYCNRHRYGVLL